MATTTTFVGDALAGSLAPDDIVRDYRIAYRSRQTSLLARGEVMLGRAMFGIFGDGKEVAQVALARAFEPGDIRSGYYRDQTLMMALGLLDVRQFFAQLYAHTDVQADPASAGRGMNAHFATRMLDEHGRWLPLTEAPQSTADVSPTGAQMPRLLGLAYASRLYRELPGLHDLVGFSRRGHEIAFGTIGNASCAEGVFWETLNAAGVLQVPMLLSVWDDGYGISVPNALQVTKGDLSALLAGFRRTAGERNGYEIATVRGWDYPALLETYQELARTVRTEHVPALVHVVELTQPQGHSTSGSHERYKTRERLAWEREHDGLLQMRRWMLDGGLATADQLDALEEEERDHVRAERDAAWNAYEEPIREDAALVTGLLDALAPTAVDARESIVALRDQLARRREPLRRDVMMAARRALAAADRSGAGAGAASLREWIEAQRALDDDRYHTHLHAEGESSALNVPAVSPAYDESSGEVDAYKVLNACFDQALRRDPRVVAFGEDVGKLGDVNQGFVDLQARFGELRVGDTGIRECTIVGQAIGLAMRGLRPIAEIQYLDYLLYALQILSDDLATVRYRTKGGQQAPVIVRTRGHRLVGVWHSGSPLGMMIHSLRGIYIAVPRDMTRAAGFYNTLLRGSDPGIVIEVLNGYRQKERLPTNIGDMTTPLGVVDVLRPGRDVTVVTYGASCAIAMEAAALLADAGVDAEVIDVQSLLPLDTAGRIAESLKKTSRVLFLDEDVPGGASAYMMREVLERQGAFYWLDAAPRTLTGAEHRPAYGRDGDYWSKPGVEDVYDAVLALARE